MWEKEQKKYPENAIHEEKRSMNWILIQKLRRKKKKKILKIIGRNSLFKYQAAALWISFSTRWHS